VKAKRGRKPKPRLEIPAKVTKEQLAALTGYSSKQVTRWLQETDIPHRRDANELVFPWPGVRTWLHRYLEEKGKRTAQPIDKDNANQRRTIAEAELIEIELAKARSELMTVAAGEKLLADAFARVRARLSNLAPRAAGVVLGCATIQEAQAKIQPVVDEIFEELRDTSDVVEDEEENGDDGD
jgi:hypothetical protein